MSAESFLSSIVEVAIGLAGFAGIIAAIRQGRITHWPREPRILLEMLLVASASAITFALLPSILAEAHISESTIWRGLSGTLLIWQVGLGVFRTRQFREGGLFVRTPRSVVVWVASIVVLQGVNTIFAASWPYLLGVLGLLGNGFYFFWRLLFDHTIDPDAAA